MMISQKTTQHVHDLQIIAGNDAFHIRRHPSISLSRYASAQQQFLLYICENKITDQDEVRKAKRRFLNNTIYNIWYTYDLEHCKESAISCSVWPSLLNSSAAVRLNGVDALRRLVLDIDICLLPVSLLVLICL